jgi:signal peptidase
VSAIRALRAVLIALESLVGLSLLTLVILTLLGYITLAVVEGNSMEPTLQTGDLVIVLKRVATSDVSVGDVVVYRRGSTLIIHRVVMIEGSTFITKGDNNWVVDPPVNSEALIGKVLEIGGRPLKVPLVGYLTLLLRYSITSLTYLPVDRNL